MSVTTIKTIEEIEKNGRLVCAKNSGYSPGMFTFWCERGHLKPADWEEHRVTVKRENGHPHTSKVRFFLRSSIDRLAAVTDSDRLRKRWQESERIVEGNDVLLRFKPACKALGKSGPTLQRWSDTDNEDGMPFWDSKVFTVVNREVKGGTFRYWYESELKAAREALKVLSTKPRREDCYTVQDAMNLTGLSYNMLAQAKQCEARGFIKFNVRVKATRKKGDQKYSRTEKRILFHKVPIDAFVANRHSLGIPVGSLTVSDAAEDLKIDPQHIHRWCRDGLIAFEKRRLPSAAKPKRDQTHYILTSTVVTLLRQVLARSRSFAEAGRTLQQQQATISAPPVQPSTASAPEQFPCKPRWDGETRTLYLGDVVVKTFDRNSATNQLDLIEAFEREGWPSSVADPFRNRRRLDETMRYWNSSNGGEFIKFGGDGTGEGVRWRHTSKGH